MGDDSTDNTVAFQAAVDAINAAGGGTIYIPTGTYRVGNAGADVLWKSNVNLVGDGIGKSIVKFTNGRQFLYNTGDVNTPLTDCTFRDFEIDGSLQTGWTKGFFFQYCLRNHYTRVKVANTGATGFGSDYMVDCSYADCVADGCGRTQTINDPGSSGFGIGTGKYQNENTQLINCTATNNKRYGAFFEKQAAGAGNYFSRGYEIIGGIFTGNQWGVGDCGVDGLIVDGATISSNVAEGFYNGAPSLLNVEGINGTVKNCEIANNGAAGIRPANGGTGYMLMNNNVHDNGA